jgi:hypothetical protein
VTNASPSGDSSAEGQYTIEILGVHFAADRKVMDRSIQTGKQQQDQFRSKRQALRFFTNAYRRLPVWSL